MRNVFCIILVIILSCTLILVSNERPVFSDLATLTVPDDYPSIQEAINNAVNGDSIYVRSGTYQENIVINKTVNLIGEDREMTIIDANWTRLGVNVLADFVNMSGFTVKNAPKGNVSPYPQAGGMELHNVFGCTISGNVLIDNGYGMLLVESSNCLIQGNLMTNNTDGMELSCGYDNTQCQHNNIVGNTFTGNSNYGIYLGRGQNNTVSNNIVTFNRIGFCTGHTNDTIFSHNLISDNVYGLFIYDSDIDGRMFNNTILYNQVGCHLEYQSRYEVWHCNFIYNAIQLTCKNQLGINNTGIWDNGSVGNFWTSFHGVDANGDGISETPYLISGGNIDHFPLINCIIPYRGPGDVDGDTDVDILDILLITGIYGSKAGETLFKPRSDLNHDGLITIIDVVMCAGNYGRKYP